ncbi:hypothetical protein N0V86_006925 [Didymella sp. IMI 355093]|nr:hypothetical protein N0V86_006925 [Didymella sp. IMI 355093]
MRRDVPIRETITYPKVTVTSDHDPYYDESSPFEHVLKCGHLITTLKPDEPCAPNCHHATSSSSLEAQKMSLSKTLKKNFYCDACVEDDTEGAIGIEASCQAAGQLPHFQAIKVVSVPCDEDGYTVEDYDPYLSSHPFDTAWPPTGDNMFEDMDFTPTRARKPKKFGPLTKTTDVSDDEPSSTAEAVAEDVDGTVAEGMRWLREEEERQRRRADEGTPSTLRRRSAARPIVISSSPDTGMSSFVVNSSSLVGPEHED